MFACAPASLRVIAESCLLKHLACLTVFKSSCGWASVLIDVASFCKRFSDAEVIVYSEMVVDVAVLFAALDVAADVVAAAVIAAAVIAAAVV